MTKEATQGVLYFDHNATTPLDERVWEAMAPFLMRHYGNPSSLYRAGRLARNAIERARTQVAALVGAHPTEVVFTSGGTEANNMALKGLAGALPPGTFGVGATEHSSVLETADSQAFRGWRRASIPVDRNGRIQRPALDFLLERDDLRFVSLMWANNETGVVQEFGDLAKRLHRRGVLFHCDAVQAAGKTALDFRACGADLVSLSAHKLYGPKGAGALVISKSLSIEPLLCGGGQERNLRAGTENVAAIVGFGAAAEIASAELEQRTTRLLQLRTKLESALGDLEGVTIFATDAERLPNTLQIGVADSDGEMLLMALDRRNIAVSSGSACASGGREPSHVLLAMGYDEAAARSAIRISLGMSNSDADIDCLIAVLKAVVGEAQERIRAMAV